MHFTIDGEERGIRSNTTTTRVDEILDAVVVAEQAELVTTDSPMTEAILSFLVTMSAMVMKITEFVSRATSMKVGLTQFQRLCTSSRTVYQDCRLALVVTCLT